MNFHSHHYCAPDCPTHCFICGVWRGFGHDEWRHMLYAMQERVFERVAEGNPQ